MVSISSSVFPPVRLISDSPAVNHLGKPDAGNPPVRFDAGAGGTTSHVASPAYSTQPPQPTRLLGLRFPAARLLDSALSFEEDRLSALARG